MLLTIIITGHNICWRNLYLAALISLGFRQQFALFSMHVHYHFISTLCRWLQSIKTEEPNFQVLAFIPLKLFLRILKGWKRNSGVFIPSDVLLFSPPCLPLPRYNFISSPSSSSSCNSALPVPGDTSLTSAGLQPQLQPSGAPLKPRFPPWLSAAWDTAGFYWVSLQWEIWFCFPQISVFSFSSNKNTEEIVSLKGALDWIKCVLTLFSLFLSSQELK